MYRVVLVDDEPMIRKGLRETVEWDSIGLEVADESANGAQAIEDIRRVRPHIVITDIKMPEMNGIQLIREIKNMDYNVKIIILSGYSDYSYLKEAIRLGVESYLLKPIDNDELTQILTEIASKLNWDCFTATQRHQGYELLINNTFNRLVTNSISPDEFAEKVGFLGLNLDYDKFVCAVLAIDQEPSDWTEKDERIILAGIQNICGDLINEGAYSFLGVEKRVVLLFSLDKDADTRYSVNAALDRVVECVQMVFGVTLIVGVGNVVESPYDMWKSYSLAVNCMGYGVFSDRSSIMWSDDVMPLSGGSSALQIIDEKELRDLIRMGDMKKLTEFAMSQFQDQAQDNIIPVDIVRNYFIQLAVKTIGVFREYSVKPEAFERLDNFDYTAVLKMRYTEKFSNWYTTLLEKLFRIGGSLQCQGNMIVGNAIAYVEKNYDMGLTIKQVAQTCNVNASYLGQIFKRDVGASFTDYINRLRIEKAKSLLRNTSFKIHEIADKVGFTDYHYFLKIFKKLEGKLPSDIR